MIYPVWFLFAAIFSYLAYVHWRYSETPLRTFRLRERAGEGDTSEDPIREFVEDFNKYLESVNGLNKSQNRTAAIGYFVAAFTSLVSLFLNLP